MTKAEEPSSSLLMAVVEEALLEILLQGKCHASAEEDDWYLDTGASSHMTGGAISSQSWWNPEADMLNLETIRDWIFIGEE